MFVDSHCHLDRLDLSPYDQDFSRFVAQTLEGGVDHLLCVSITLEKFGPMRSLVDPYPEISVSVGVHPTEEDVEEPTIDRLIGLAEDSRVVAIGETGLDYFRIDGDIDWQQERFRTHIRAAISTSKPLIIHTREAREDTIRILREEGAHRVGGVLHCFTEDWEMAQAAMDLNFYISLSGILTFKNAQQIQDVAQRAPLDRLLIETDSPYLAPIPMRGKPNYPLYVRHVAECLAGLRGLTVEEVAASTTRNFYRLFPLARTQGAHGG
ncbi:MAG: TatD family deoxyribonuclease [Gammaproteobacteria bacterium]|nr:TatD family deoxyribonuclease [Gammaproteobacteria bacterium]NBY23708.1 TatD family deoxyribonuclease [Gammaproteobacteria bacterium]NDE33304.1 TatD family deoxyribonuclease [Gammaproteobacteria bacterium]NDE55322.1 TatD family deoxyribonuclease [Gammaproteobacteria bacterium]NDG86377.1 TatD family deoxyribonuclease [Gammaproteobacteria bacterium]